jgi:hypothetical protein
MFVLFGQSDSHLLGATNEASDLLGNITLSQNYRRNCNLTLTTVDNIKKILNTSNRAIIDNRAYFI